MKPVYSIVVPAYNEEEVINVSYLELKKVMDQAGGPYELIFVNDGSRDKTLPMLIDICKKDPNVRVINFSRNHGHQLAITAGMDNARGDAVVVIDADLQDPPEVILQFIEKWREGYEVVYGKRSERQGETGFKKATASLYYRFLKSMTTVDIPVDTGDFRLIDRKVCAAMKSIREKNRYIRGLISWVGYKQTAVAYVRHERYAGETKYPLKKMVKLAVDGLISFSDKPLKLPFYIGGAVCGLSFLFIIISIITWIAGGIPQGAFLLFELLFFLQGLLFIVIGFMGEYLTRIYDEARNRPLYLISEIIDQTTFKGADEIDG